MLKNLLIQGGRVIDPASNFDAVADVAIANGKVLVPTFGQPSDAQALGILQDLMPRHRVIGLDGRWLVTQYGNIHCVTQQIPDVAALSSGG